MGKVLPTDKHASLGGPGIVTVTHSPDKEGLKTWSATNPAGPWWMYDVIPPEATPVPSARPSQVEVDQGKDSGYRFSDLAGQVEVNEPNPDGTYDEENWHYAKLNEEIRVGAHIRTCEKSGALITAPTMASYNMAPGSEIIIASPFAHDSELKILWGNLKVNVQKMMKDGSMTVEMSQAAASIKSTVFIVEENLLSSTLKVIEGQVAYTVTNGTTLTVNAGEQMTANADNTVSKKAFDVSTASSYDTIFSSASPTPSTPDSSSSKKSDFLSPVAVIALIAIVAIAKGKRR